MTDIVTQAAMGFWATLGEMAPYLLFGFAAAGLLSLLISAQAVQRHLGGPGMWPVVKAALFGVPLPLCSCGVIPVAASLRKHGASRGATTAFLISTPQTGVDSILVTFSLLGPVFAIFRPVAAFVSGVLGGALVALAAPDDSGGGPEQCESACCSGGAVGARVMGALRLAFLDLPQDIGKALIVGLLVAGVMSAVVPDDFFASILGTGITAMVVMMLVGIPIYVCATASVPIAAALIAKGISPGAALVFLMTGPATNAATIAIVWKTMGRRTAALYLFAVAVTALAAGVTLDYVLKTTATPAHAGMGWMLPQAVNTVSALVLAALLVISFVRSGRGRSQRTPEPAEGSLVLAVEGMTCDHCVRTVRSALLACPNVKSVNVDLKAGRAVVIGDTLDVGVLTRAVEKAGFVGSVVQSKEGDES